MDELTLRRVVIVSAAVMATIGAAFVYLAMSGGPVPDRTAAVQTPRPSGVAKIDCPADGSTEVLTPVVAAQRDGVRTVVKLGKYRSTWIDGLRVQVKGETVRTVSAASPGEHEVRCEVMNDHRTWNGPTEKIRIVDPSGYWIPPIELKCRPGEGSGTLMVNGSGLGEKGDAAVLVRKMYRDEMRAGDEVVLSGYRDGGDRRFHVVRDGRSIREGGAWRFGDRWKFNNLSSCSSMKG